MPELPSIDVIVPVFNHAQYLSKCLSSVLEQTYLPNQIICVDDASTDPEIQTILDAFALKNPRIQVIYLPNNSGICHTQNTAIAAAKSDYIAFLDCDDWLAPDALQTMATSIAEQPCGYAFSDRVDTYDSTDKEEIRVYGGQPQLKDRGSHKDNLIDHMIASHLKVIKKSAIDQVGGFAKDTEGVQDWDMALKLSEITEFIYVPKPIYFHRIHTNQNSSYDSGVNTKKVNEIRRTVLNKRFNQQEKAKYQFSIPNFVKEITEAVPDFLKKVATSAVFFAMDAKGTMHFIPQTPQHILDLQKNHEISEILVFGKDEIELDFIRYFWSMPQRPRLGYYLADVGGIFYSAQSLRFSNSYFDYVLCNSPEAHISTLGYMHHNLEVLVHRPVHGPFIS